MISKLFFLFFFLAACRALEHHRELFEPDKVYLIFEKRGKHPFKVLES
jgi:hypothetical protein